VQDEKGLNAQTGGAGGQGQATKEESGVAPNLTEFAPLIDFTTGSFRRLNGLMSQILIDFRAENKAKLEAQKAQEERDDIMWVESLLGSIDELRKILIELVWREYNESFFNNPANVKWFATIVTKLAIIFNNFEMGKVDYTDLIITLENIRFELQRFFLKAIGAKPLIFSS
jgi:hypothetical protein